MNGNRNINYNANFFDEAINEAKKLTNVVNESIITKCNAILTAIPSGFKSAGTLRSLINNIQNACDKLTNVEVALSRIKSILDEYISDSELKRDLKNAGYFQTTINGVEGYLYIPSSVSSTVGLPLVTYLAGSPSHYILSELVDSSGIPSLLSKGYQLNAVVWVPTGTAEGKWFKKDDPKNTVCSIKKIISDYGLDSSRNALIGYSIGAVGGFEMVKNNPNFFSTLVTFGQGALLNDDENINPIASSNTTIIMYTGTEDKDGSANANETFKALSSNGADVIMYSVENADHLSVSYMPTDELMEDVIYIRNNRKYLNDNAGNVISLSNKEFQNSSIFKELETSKAEGAAYYLKLTSDSDKNYKQPSDIVGNQIISFDEEIFEDKLFEDKLFEEEIIIETVEPDTSPIQTLPSETVKPDTSPIQTLPSETVKPDTSPMQTLPSETVKPDTSLNNLNINIFPENKFSNGLPSMSNGRLGSMEISSNEVTYEILNVNQEIYNSYLEKLKNYGYINNANGVLTNGMYEVIINLADDGNSMSINLNLVN